MDRIARFRDAKFGMFVHWGPYSVAGVEASWPVMLGPELQKRFVEALHEFGMGEVAMPVRPITHEEYRGLPQQFDPVGFDADQWAELARSAGQRYLVMTTKHHDGFCMYDSAQTDYSIMRTPFGRDVTSELAVACERAGLAFGTYFSAPDIEHPGYRDPSLPPPANFLGQPERAEWAGYLDYMEAQVRELCTRYGELFCVWWDIGFGAEYPVERLHRVVRDLQPGCLLNDRLGGLDRALSLEPDLAADYLTPEQSVPRSIPRWSKVGTPTDPTMLFSLIQRDDWRDAVQQVAPVVRAMLDVPVDSSVPEPADFLPWESCLTFGGQWAYSPDLHDFKSGADLITSLVEIASRGGNLLMNVGPRPDGTIQPEFQTALREVGRWLEGNGAAIHGSTFGPVQGVEGLRTTATDDRVFVHLLEPPADRVVRLALDADVAAASVLDGGAPVEVSRAGRIVSLDLTTIDFDPVVTTIALACT